MYHAMSYQLWANPSALCILRDWKEIMSLMSMKKALSLLDKNRFLRIHKSYIISLNQIDVIEKDHVKLKNITIPICEVYRINILNVLKKHK